MPTTDSALPTIADGQASPGSESSLGRTRFAFVDALRGLAAIAVVFRHVYALNLVDVAASPLPEPLHSLLTNGDLGVVVFFVLSGFVIAHSVGDRPLSGGYVGRFVLRRSLRLDPPYWATLALIVVTAFLFRYGLDRSTEIPRWEHVLAHACYLQDYLRLPPLLGVAWTLCQEIQFYLVFVLLTAWGRKTDRSGGRSETTRTRTLLALLTVAGVATFASWIPNVPGSFLGLWPFFAVGVLCNWTARGRLSKSYASALALPAMVVIAFIDPKWGATLFGTAALLYWTMQTNQIVSLSLGPVVQFLGRISYSLYLTHMLTGCRLARFMAERFARPFDGPMLCFSLLLSVCFSVVTAYLFFLIVERPSHLLSKKIRLRRVSQRA